MPITDLTGYTWVGNSSLSLDDVLNTYYINFTSNNVNFTAIDFPIPLSGPFTLEYDSSVEGIYEIVYDTGTGWANEAYKTIVISGGTDATNSDLIAWLEANGTLTAPAPAGNVYEITHSLTNLTHGNVSFTITPDSGYSLPSSVTVTNGTLVSYDSSTGVVVVNGDNAEISVDCEVASVGYSGNITATKLTASGNEILADDSAIKIKFGSVPSSADDYDTKVDVYGTITGLTSYTNQSIVYAWIGDGAIGGQLSINNTHYSFGITKTYDNPVSYAITGNGNIILYYFTLSKPYYGI